MVEVTFVMCEDEDNEDIKCIHYKVCKKRIDIEQQLKSLIERNEIVKEIKSVDIEFDQDCGDFKT